MMKLQPCTVPLALPGVCGSPEEEAEEFICFSYFLCTELGLSYMRRVPCLVGIAPLPCVGSHCVALAGK